MNQTFEKISKEELRRSNIKLEKVSGEIKIRKMTFQPEGLQAPIIQVNRIIIKNKQSVGIIGSVGSGKSTLLKLIAGVLTPTSGTVSFGNFDTTAVNQTV